MFRWITLLLVLTACNSQSPVPPGVLPEKEMESLIFEIHIAEAIVTSDFIQGVDPKLRQQMLIDSLLMEKNVDRETFQKSYEYYLAHPARMDSIYTHIIDSLNHALTKARALEAESVKK